MNLRHAAIGAILGLVGAQSVQSACSDISIPRWTISSVSSSIIGRDHGNLTNNPRTSSAIYLKKFNMVDSTGKNRGHLVLNGAYTIIDTNYFPGTQIPPSIYVRQDTASVETTIAVDAQLMQAFANGWKLTRISNSSRPFSGSGCQGLQNLHDTVYRASRHSFEFQR
ncbi:MAG: hypothetical protein AAB214_13885 [Fibrobacterota bacterium]